MSNAVIVKRGRWRSEKPKGS